MPVEVKNIHTVILDIEGTICPISFVKEVMYPAALTTLETLLDHSSGSVRSGTPFPPPSLAPYTAAFPASAIASAPEFLAHIKQLTASDSKAAELKALQGYLWRASFESGALVSPLYSDVRPSLASWRSNGMNLAIFSSGSVAAQKLFLAHSGVQGIQGGGEVKDLNPWFTGNYDTINAGAKNEKTSYQKIVAELDAQAGEALFLSDNVNEIRAAVAAGLVALVVDRPGNAPLTEEDRREFPVITSLADIEFG